MLTKLSLQNFRSYKSQYFTFAPITIFVGKNTIGKTNILEAIHMLATGKSFRAEKDVDTINLESDFAKIDAILEDNSNRVKISMQLLNNSATFHKRYFLNDVGKRQNNIAQVFYSVIFSPQDLEIISESPTMRRRYIDGVLSLAHSEYSHAVTTYSKALRQRNRLLGLIKDGKRVYSQDEFLYWNSLLMDNATIIFQYRKRYLEYLNTAEKTAYELHITYDTSLVTQERLDKYKEAELASGVTLIGPQREDFLIQFADKKRLVREFGSRGEQRLSVLQLKLLEIEYLFQETGQKPILLLDDIFSELDSANIDLISRMLPHQQSVITTTHLEHIPSEILNQAKIMRLPKDLENAD